MGKSRRPVGDGEIKDNKRLQLEVAKLKKQLSSLRKQLSRVDIDRYQNLKELIESHEEEDESFDGKAELEQLKLKWECNTCGKDFLRLVIITRIDHTYYFRRCQTCGNKTKLKKYNSLVEGIDTNDKIISKT